MSGSATAEMEVVFIDRLDRPDITRSDMVTMEREFIKKYEDLPLLWSKEHPEYSNKFKRNLAYDKLVPILRKYLPVANRFNVRQKINILRSSYRKELKKYLSSKTITTDGDIVCLYKPPSWKFEAMKFLLNENEKDFDFSQSESEVVIEEPVDYEDTLNDMEEPELEYIQETEVESLKEEEPESAMSPLRAEQNKPYILQKRYSDDLTAESGNEDPDMAKTMQIILNQKRPTVVRNNRKRPKSHEHFILDRECTAVGSNVTCKLQRMEVEQRHYAEQLVHKILVRGLRGTLTEDTDFNDIKFVIQYPKTE